MESRVEPFLNLKNHICRKMNLMDVWAGTPPCEGGGVKFILFKRMQGGLEKLGERFEI